MNKPTWKRGTYEDANGTSLQGYLDISYDELRTAFGEPEDGDGYKVDAEWIFLVADGITDTPSGLEPVTIYNWKNGPNYNDGRGNITHITEWHIGGRSGRAVMLARMALGLDTAKSVGWL